MPKRSPPTGSSPDAKVGATSEPTSSPPVANVPADKAADSVRPDAGHYDKAIQNLVDMLAGEGAHTGHKRRQVGRCVLCSCGIRVQGRLSK